MSNIIIHLFLIIFTVRLSHSRDGHSEYDFGFNHEFEEEFLSPFDTFEENSTENEVRIPFLQNVWFYLPKLSSNLTKECREDLTQLIEAFRDPKAIGNNGWPFIMVDSWGKYEDGRLQGNRLLLGFFDECSNIEVDTSALVRGRYCLMTYGSMSPNDGLSKFSMILPLLGLPINSYYGTCIPSSCSKEELMESVSDEMASNGLELRNVQCQSQVDERHFDSAEIFGITFFSIITFVVLLSSVLDICIDHFKIEKLKHNIIINVLRAFSVPRNLSKIFNIETRKDSNVISCIHGMRVLSISWVILGHQYYYTFHVASNDGFIEISKGFFMQIIINGDKVVDTFLTLSGLLVSYGFFRNCYAKKKFPFVQYYLLRIIRLTPPILMCVIFVATMGSFLPYGPLAPKYVDEKVEACRAFWWLDWTYFSNFVYRFGNELMEKKGESNSCIPQAWYLSVDMQLYIVMPIILVPFLYSKKYGFNILTGATIVSFAIPAIIIGISGTYPSSMLTLNVEESVYYAQHIYMMPYCRASPYLIGVFAGYILWKTSEQTITLTPSEVVFGWTASAIVGFLIVFGLYPFNYLDKTNPADDISLWYSILYGALHRGLWGICISWVVLACHWGYGGMVNSFLSHPGIQPLSRLSYCLYIVSLPIQDALIYSTMRPTYYNHVTKISETCGILFYSGIGALILTLISEAPVLNIQKLLMKK